MAKDRKFLDNDYLSLIIRLFVGAVFIYAAMDKVAHPIQFARIVYNYHFLPTILINVFAIVMPWVEITCGIALIFGFFRSGGVLLVNLLVLSFLIALGVNLFRGINIECGCFTVSGKAKENILGLLIRDAGMLVLTIYLFLNRSKRFSLIKS
jgi:uncharacterized membrane protein YphA (DoxX/SURF4 family)